MSHSSPSAIAAAAHCACLCLVWGLAFAAVAPVVRAAEPHIEKFERFGSNLVLIHFETAPNRRYFVQVITNLSCGTNTGPCSSQGVPTNQWSNIYTTTPLPFINHYIVPDTMRGPRQFYRLRVTP